MKKLFLFATIVLFALFLVAGLVMISWADRAFSQNLEPVGTDETMPPDNSIDPHALPLTAQATGDKQLVYFNPQDSDGTATVVTLYNTEPMTTTVDIQAFDESGILMVNGTVTLGPNRRVYVISDSVAVPPPPSFDSALGNTFFANFSDFSNYAVMSVPQGVKFDGYVVFNQGSNTINPRLDQGAIPLHFSTDPLSIFLPSVQSKP